MTVVTTIAITRNISCLTLRVRVRCTGPVAAISTYVVFLSKSILSMRANPHPQFANYSFRKIFFEWKEAATETV